MEELTTVQSSEKISSKLWFKILSIFIGILIVIGLFGNIYLLLKNQKPPATSKTPAIPTQIIATPTPDPTANWKTYRDEKYEIEFKYPPGWQVELTGDEGSDEYPVISDEKNDENNFVVRKLCHSNCLSFSDPKNEYKISEVKINSINWIKREHPTWEEFVITSYPNLNCCLRFIASPVGQKNGILDLILSTFKFLK